MDWRKELQAAAITIGFTVTLWIAVAVVLAVTR